jgi:LDH2 family malate/lactate/ureidoglycolate dehydrogenase
VQPLYGDFAVPYDCSHLFIAIDVAHFGDPGVFRAASSAAADRLRTGPRAPGVTQLFAPGEPEWRARERAAGQVALAPAVADMLIRLAREMQVSAEPLAADDELTRQDLPHAEA